MKYLGEYRDPKGVRDLAEVIRRETTRPWRIMEVCGGQTHSLIRFGIDQLLPKSIELIHGPGCPVCVTPMAKIDAAVELARRPDVILCSFGDMLRVPGSRGDLLSAKAEGGDVRIVYSPLDAVALARANPDRPVVFFAVGFETTAPANAMAVYRAAREGLRNFFALVSHVRVPPAMEAILSDPLCRVQGFLAAGHVCTIMGTEEYEPIARRYRVPIVVAGFEPVDLLEGILHCVRQLESGRFGVENQYERSVRTHGNRDAIRMLEEVFRVDRQTWRGLGEIPDSGLHLREEFAPWNAEVQFDLSPGAYAPESGECRSGEVLKGLLKPPDCPAFGRKCTPERPLGATMVSSEGACAAYYRYRPSEVRLC